MPGKTNTDLIHELREAVAALGVRANQTDVALADMKDQRDRLIKLEVKLEHLEKQRGEEHGRTWAIKLAILSALIGSVFTILTQLLSRFLPIK